MKPTKIDKETIKRILELRKKDVNWKNIDIRFGQAHREGNWSRSAVIRQFGTTCPTEEQVGAL